MIEYLYIAFLVFIACAGFYQWGVARGEELAEQKREQEEQQQRVNRYRW